MLTNYIPINDRRYIVGWEPKADREMVFVFDRLIGRIVFTSNSGNRFKHSYPYIKRYYGENNCMPGKQLRYSDYVT